MKLSTTLLVLALLALGSLHYASANSPPSNDFKCYYIFNACEDCCERAFCALEEQCCTNYDCCKDTCNNALNLCQGQCDPENFCEYCEAECSESRYHFDEESSHSERTTPPTNCVSLCKTRKAAQCKEICIPVKRTCHRACTAVKHDCVEEVRCKKAECHGKCAEKKEECLENCEPRAPSSNNGKNGPNNGKGPRTLNTDPVISIQQNGREILVSLSDNRELRISQFDGYNTEGLLEAYLRKVINGYEYSYKLRLLSFNKFISKYAFGSKLAVGDWNNFYSTSNYFDAYTDDPEIIVHGVKAGSFITTKLEARTLENCRCGFTVQLTAYKKQLGTSNNCALSDEESTADAILAQFGPDVLSYVYVNYQLENLCKTEYRSTAGSDQQVSRWLWVTIDANVNQCKFKGLRLTSGAVVV